MSKSTEVTADRRVKTRQEVLADFEARGKTVTDWAVAHGYRRESVYAVLSGRTRGRRGAAHQIALALGIKLGPIDDLEGTYE